MSRTALFLAAAGILATVAFTSAQETAPPGLNARRTPPIRSEPPGPPPQPPVEEEIRAIHQILEQQSKQLDVLAREIAQLSVQVAAERKESAELAARSTGGPAAPPSAAPSPAPPGAAEVPAHEVGDAPKAEVVADAAGKHTVAKGETLTSIAKEYNIPLAELQKANKIPDVRRLQIGQVLNIPTSKTPESSTDKKEKP